MDNWTKASTETLMHNYLTQEMMFFPEQFFNHVSKNICLHAQTNADAPLDWASRSNRKCDICQWLQEELTSTSLQQEEEPWARRWAHGRVAWRADRRGASSFWPPGSWTPPPEAIYLDAISHETESNTNHRIHFNLVIHHSRTNLGFSKDMCLGPASAV